MSVPKFFEKAIMPFLFLFLLLFVACNPLGEKPKVEEDFAPGIDQTIELTELTYSGSSFSFTKNAAITNLTPTLATGVALSYSITPDLPTGLSFDSLTGIISGTPTSIQVASDYTITANNEELSTSVTISLSVVSTSAVQSSVGVDTSSITANGASTVTVTITLRDVENNPIIGNLVSLVSSRGVTDTISAISATTNSFGVATFSVTSTTSGSATFTATDATESLGITQTQSVTFNPGLASKLFFSTEPSTTGVAGVNLTTQPVVSILDAFDNLSTSIDSITLSLYSDSNCVTAVTTTPSAGSSTSGTLTVAAIDGVSTFAGIKINKSAATLYFKAASGALTTDCSNAMNIASAAFDLDESTLSVSSTTVTAGSSITTTLTAKDEFGNANPSGVTTVTFDSTVIGGTGSFGSNTNLGNGVFTASFTGALVGSVTLSGEINGDAITETEAVTVNFGSVASIIFSTSPSTTANTDTALASQPVITAKDAQGNTITSDDTSSITLEAHSNSSCTAAVASGISADTNPETMTDGVATFSNVKLLKTNVIRIKASDGTRTVCSSSNITVSPGAIASIGFTTEPSTTGDTDSTLSQQPVVKAYDANSNIVTNNSTTSIILTAYSDACSTSVASGITATLNPKTLALGVATFAGVKLLKTNAIRIGASDGTHTACSGSDITVSAGAINSIAFTTEPSSTGNTDSALSQQPVVKAYDANSNIVTNNSTDSITLTAYSDACSTSVASGITATLNPKTLALGVATFAGVKLLKTNAIRIGASDGTHTACSGSNITVSPGAVASIAFTTQPSNTGDADTVLAQQPVIKTYDANSNIVTSDSSSSITLEAHSNSGCTSFIASGITATLNPQTAALGIATFAGVKVLKTNAISIKASDGTRTACSDAIAISAGALSTSNSTLAATPLSIAADNSATSTFTATILDQNQNPISGQSVTLASSRGATDTIVTSPATTNSSGVATLTVKSSTVGNPTLTLTAGAFSKTRKLYFLSQTPLLDFQARYAKDGLTQGDTTVTQWWKDLTITNTTNDFELFNFSNPNNAWAGNGGSTLTTDPYRLTFSSASSQYLESTDQVNAGNDVYFETWVRPSSSTTKGSIIFSNGDASNKGFVLKQSSAEAGKVEVKLGSTNTYAEEVMADSPISYWRLGEKSNTSSINLGSCGGTVSDCDGTYIGGFTLGNSHSAWGDSDAMVTFNGSSGYVNVGDKTPLQFERTNQLSVEAWFKTSNSAGTNVIVSKQLNAGNYTGYRMLTNTNGKLEWGMLATQALLVDIQTSMVVADGNWHHVVGTYSGNSLASGFKIFIDGVEDTSATVLGDNLGTNTILSAASFNIGARNGAALYFNGSLDEVSVYSSVLTPTRILAHYNSRARPVCRTFSTLTNSSWSHIAGLFNSTTGAFKLFFNGTQECSMTLSSPTNLYAGSTESLKAAPTPFWSGDIAEVRASNTVVTNNNVIDHYNTESGNYPSFLPSSISGLVLWLDASDSATLFQNSNCTSSPVTANGDIVACWKDKSASNLHATQGTSARQPIYASSSINSKPGVTFGSVDYDVLTTSSITLTARSYFVVTKNNGASRGSVHSLILQGASPYYQIYGSPNYLYYQINNPNTGVVISGNQLVSLTSSSGIVSIRFNGNTYLNYTGTASSVSSGFHIGGYVAGGYGLNGDILEMIVFDNAISETDLKRVEAYLNSKYKIY